MYTAAIAYQVNNPLPDTSGKKLYFFFENVSKLKKKKLMKLILISVLNGKFQFWFFFWSTLLISLS